MGRSSVACLPACPPARPPACPRWFLAAGKTHAGKKKVWKLPSFFFVVVLAVSG